jgi:16S rRNA C967 or C1407 C5-methylase (RsmB/RsmF family)
LEQSLTSKFPIEFIKELQNHFGEKIAEKTLKALSDTSSVSIRINPLKPIEGFSSDTPIPWSKNGHLLKDRPFFSLDPHFHAGCYYVQESSSMILETLLNKLKPERDGLYLDACAAPGGKSTVLLDYLNNEGFLLSNEVDGKRNSILREIILKWGRLNVGVTSLPTRKFIDLNCAFDLILVDAPCSGEGMFRKDKFALTQWSEKLVQNCAITQKTILNELTPTLKQGGILIYSTCTMNREENEYQIQKLIESGDFEIEEVDLSDYQEHLIEAKIGEKTIGHYLLPGTSTGEGLFISVLRKKTPSENEDYSTKRIQTSFNPPNEGFENLYPQIPKDLVYWELKEELFAVKNHSFIEHLAIPLKMVGLPFYQMKGKNVIPLHGMAMANLGLPSIELDKENSLQYLRKETISLPQNLPKGWALVGFQNKSLGWIKIIDQRSNNYYPSWSRLRN